MFERKGRSIQMKKVVAFMGSPRKKGNTAALVGEAIRGIKAAGVEAKVYNLNEMNIKPCQSCYYCRANEGCPIKDDMSGVYEDLKHADAVVIGSPVYMFQVSAQVKLLFDRLFPMMNAEFKPRWGAKKTLMLYTQGNPDPKAFAASFATNEEILKVMGLNVIETIVSSDANELDATLKNKALLGKVFEAGKSLA